MIEQTAMKGRITLGKYMDSNDYRIAAFAKFVTILNPISLLSSAVCVWAQLKMWKWSGCIRIYSFR
jgi:hypothetical protein